MPVAVDGTCEPETFDFYKFNAAAGQRITCEVVARRLGYALDPAIRLLDATGKELAYSDDEPGIGADCRFAHTFAAAGTYTLEIRDIRYAGGPTHRYRMRIGNFPLSTTTFPMGARRGSTPKLQLSERRRRRRAPVRLDSHDRTRGPRNDRRQAPRRAGLGDVERRHRRHGRAS